MHRIIPTLFALVILMASGVATAAETFPGADKEAFEKALRTYLLENPEVVVEALEKYEAKRRLAREKATATALVTNRDKLLNHPMTPISGNKDGDVTVVEFFDYQCGFCKRSLAAMLDIIKEDPQVKVIWKELPILGPTSRFAAQAAMAAKRQDKYLEFHRAVMGARGQLSPNRVMKLAGKAGLDVDKLKEDMADPAIQRYLDETLRLARELGISGTPGFVIGKTLVPGAIDKSRMKQLIAAARQQS